LSTFCVGEKQPAVEPPVFAPPAVEPPVFAPPAVEPPVFAPPVFAPPLLTLVKPPVPGIGMHGPSATAIHVLFAQINPTP
jgi:hypothetical protein